MEIATISAAAAPTHSGILELIKNAYSYFSYFLPPATFLALVGLGVKIGHFQKSFDDLTATVNKLNPVVVRLNSCVQEIQTIMKNKYKTVSILQETLDFYGIANSPIVLKDEFRPFVEKSGLVKQVKAKKGDLVEWLKKKNPKTGLDAQNMILEFVVSDDVEKYLDTRKYKELLYESGKTTKDYYVILGIYLFETIIPEVVGE